MVWKNHNITSHLPLLSHFWFFTSFHLAILCLLTSGTQDLFCFPQHHSASKSILKSRDCPTASNGWIICALVSTFCLAFKKPSKAIPATIHHFVLCNFLNSTIKTDPSIYPSRFLRVYHLRKKRNANFSSANFALPSPSGGPQLKLLRFLELWRVQPWWPTRSFPAK